MTFATCVQLPRQAQVGAVNHHNGVAAEQAVARHYADQGYPVIARRWRGTAGELDLVFGKGTGFIVVEVKSARSHDQAALRFGARQMSRVSQTAQQFLGQYPSGLNTELRIDLALVDQFGIVATLENVTLQ